MIPAAYDERLSMQGAAKRIGLAYDTFRKAWKRMTETQDFPAPIIREPFAYKWDAAAIDRWIQRRSAQVVCANPKPEPRPRPPSRSGRAALQAIKG